MQESSRNDNQVMQQLLIEPEQTTIKDTQSASDVGFPRYNKVPPNSIQKSMASGLKNQNGNLKDIVQVQNKNLLSASLDKLTPPLLTSDPSKKQCKSPLPQFMDEIQNTQTP